MSSILWSPTLTHSDSEEQTLLSNGESVDASSWLTWASKAWRYFQPRVGVDSDTGLSHAGLGWPYLTEWDLATYVLAILDAEKIGLLPSNGFWGATERLDRIMDFLENRELSSQNLSYLWYDAQTGAPAHQLSNASTNVSDLGFLLIALHALKNHRPEYASTIDWVVHERMNVTQLASHPEAWRTTSGVYEWFVAHGFQYFGFHIYQPVAEALNTLNTILESPQVTTYNVSLPRADITSEPLILAALTLPTERGMWGLVLSAYVAQRNRYHATGEYTAFSEGNTGLPGYPSYVYEWIVRNNGETWQTAPTPITPIAYIKVAFAYYALFHNQYALNLLTHLNASFTSHDHGYWDGVDEEGRVVDVYIDRTNGMVLASARYALENPVLSNLDDYPHPFVSPLNALNTTLIVGDTDPHPPLNWGAYTMDHMGALNVSSKLRQLSTTGDSTQKLDTQIVFYNHATGDTEINWDSIGSSTMMIIGGPLVNLAAYHVEQYEAFPFHAVWSQDIPYLHSQLTGRSYAFQWASVDYALIAIYSNNNRTVLVGWGLTHWGTQAVCQILQHFDTQPRYRSLLTGYAVIIRWIDVNRNEEVDLVDQIAPVETWP